MEALAEDLGLDCTQADAERDHASLSNQTDDTHNVLHRARGLIRTRADLLNYGDKSGQNGSGESQASAKTI